MDMGDSSMSSGPACKISMLWNWYTVDACFLSSDWHIYSNVAFAFSVICVFLIVALTEGVRRFGREYDRRIVLLARGNLKATNDSTSDLHTFVPSWSQQVIRATIFGIQFGVAYIIMLLAMYYNGYIIFAIILGGAAGHFLFGRDTVVSGSAAGDKGASCC